MAFSKTWKIKEYSSGGTTSYKVKASTTNLTTAEKDRFIAQFAISGTLTAVTPTAAQDPDNLPNWKVSLEYSNADPETAHESLVTDIDATQDALTAQDTQVDQANVVTTGEIEVFATGKITVTIAEP